LPRTIQEGDVRDFGLKTSAAEIRRLVPRSACVVSFEPAHLLAADRLPSVGDRRRFAVDSYVSLLLEQMDRSRKQYDSSAAAFGAQPLDTSLIEALRTCDFAIIAGFPGFRLLSPAQQKWLSSTYRQVDEAPDVWKRRTLADYELG
jgi:hypothetical protein